MDQHFTLYVFANVDLHVGLCLERLFDFLRLVISQIKILRLKLRSSLNETDKKNFCNSNNNKKAQIILFKEFTKSFLQNKRKSQKPIDYWHLNIDDRQPKHI